MIALSLAQLATAVNGRLHSANSLAETIINHVTTDSRKPAVGSLFIALKGERFDAHDFAPDVVNAGASALLVNRELAVDCPQVIVHDTHQAMGKLASWVRDHSQARIVGLTGSSGKTSVKEMTAAILSHCGDTLYTEGNLNNDIGVPLTLFRLTPEHRYAVVEMGANHVSEIAYTTAMVKPQGALVNNLFSAHLEGFGSLAGVAKAKGEIFLGLAENGTAIINLDSHDWDHWQSLVQDEQTVWRFSVTEQEGADFYPTHIQITPCGTDFTLHSPVGSVPITLPLPGKHNIANALAASALALSVGASLDEIRHGLMATKAVPGRLFPVVLAQNKIVLDDTYNANTGSMIAAIHLLAEMPEKRIFVVGDMGELGDYADECHREVGRAAKDAKLDYVFSVGKYSENISHESGVGRHFSNKAELLSALIPFVQQQNVVSILVKGSRSTAMEEVVNALKESFQC